MEATRRITTQVTKKTHTHKHNTHEADNIDDRGHGKVGNDGMEVDSATVDEEERQHPIALQRRQSTSRPSSSSSAAVHSHTHPSQVNTTAPPLATASSSSHKRSPAVLNAQEIAAKQQKKRTATQKRKERKAIGPDDIHAGNLELSMHEVTVANRETMRLQAEARVTNPGRGRFLEGAGAAYHRVVE